MSEIDEMPLTGNGSSSRKSTEVPLTASGLLEKSADLLVSDISISRSSSISSSSMGSMGNAGSSSNSSGSKSGNLITKTSTPVQSRRQHNRGQSGSADSQGKGNNVSQLSPNNNENGKASPMTDEDVVSADKSPVSEESTLKADAETESENSTSETFFTPSASIHNLSGHLTTTSTNGSESQMSASIHSGDSIILDEAETESKSNCEINSSISRGLDGSRARSLSDLSNNDGGSLTNSINSELTISVDSTASKESVSSSCSQTNSKEALLPGMYNAKLPAKKKMWYHVFQPSYKTRSSDFKRYFKDLPPEERLIVDYSCALQRDILVQGRMYVSQSYISFHANIFGWETLTCIRLKDVASITKEKTALVIPNAIQVCTETERFFFASFVGRDSTFMMLFKLWQTALLQEESMPLRDVWQLVHSCYGEIGSEEEDEDYLSVSSGNQNTSPSIILSTTPGGNTSDEDKVGKSIGIDEILDSGLSTLIPTDDDLPTSRSSTLKAANGLSNGVAAESDSSDSEGEIIVPADDVYLEVPVPVCPVSHTQGVQVVNTVIPCDVDQLFTMLFTKSKFYWDFHTNRKTFNIVQGDWEQDFGKAKKVRQVSFTVTLSNPMGPKHSQVTETQTLLPESKPGLLYAIDAESVNAGIPYEDSFYVTCHFCLSRISAHESKLIIVSQVKYKKSVNFMIKPFIEKNSWAGIKEFYSHLEQAVKEECAKVTVAPHSPTPSIRMNGPTAVVRRRKYRAPSPPCSTSAISIDKENIPINGATLSKEDENVMSQLAGASSLIFKATLVILMVLLLLNAYLFVKLIRLETAANSPSLFQPPPTFTTELPQNHQEWLLLLQRQEALHRLELQKWHEVLMAALQILHQAETDLQLLTLKISSYSEGKATVYGLKGNEDNPLPVQSKPQVDSGQPGHRTGQQIQPPESEEKLVNPSLREDM